MKPSLTCRDLLPLGFWSWLHRESIMAPGTLLHEQNIKNLSTLLIIKRCWWWWGEQNDGEYPALVVRDDMNHSGVCLPRLYQGIQWGDSEIYPVNEERIQNSTHNARAEKPYRIAVTLSNVQVVCGMDYMGWDFKVVCVFSVRAASSHACYNVPWILLKDTASYLVIQVISKFKT